MSELKWTTKRPDFACVFVGRNGDDYSLWEFVWCNADGGRYLAWCESDGEEYDDIDECNFSEYLVLKRTKAE